MKTVVLTVASIDTVADDAKQAFRRKAKGEYITFASTNLLWKVLAPNRMAIVKALIGSKPLLVSEIAGSLGRNIKAVQNDVRMLLKLGILDQTESEKIVFSYDAIHVDFML